jgi:glycosyltransferase involved in cell wall biosynthesis
VRIAVVGPLEFPGRQGGMSRHIEEVYARLADRGHSVTVYCRRASEGPTYRGMDVATVPAIPRSPFDRFSYSAIASWRAAASGADVVHYHSYANSGWSFLPRWRGSAVVMTVHRLEWLDEKWGRIAAAILRTNAAVVHRAARSFIAVSHEFEEFLHAHVPAGRPVARIPNGVTLPATVDDDAPARFGVAPDGYVLAVSRLVPEKGLDVLVDALERADRADQADGADQGDQGEDRAAFLPVLVAGAARQPSAFSAALADRAERSATPVRLLGVQPGAVVHGLYRGARALVAPSRAEGNPLTVIEAMAHGCCVVASDIPPHRELLGDAGILVPVGDAAALGRALRTVAADPGTAHRLGAAARARLEASGEYQWDAVAARTESVLLAAVGG